ncbi:hypothetical protein PMZ80_004161 [Knufia obscura]|uniref:DUF7053 domain-containing protein n=2 Tax=Knufia TaxID=430999 RepID=A0AAN8ED96_9EURO|nr:hypothetical protein PMZ80_004161 [Knufia obscura]KAK5948713.1 hypothetical protein OHC33_010316 [Knufia fluminis]
MGKKTVFTNITPLPPQVSREVAIAMLQNHDEMIELNPLVIEHHPIKTPRDAPKDEFLDCTWQELTDRIPLAGGIAKRKVSYKACFHDLPNGLQTHIYAPMNLDIREKWTVCGTLPGEPDEPRELGLNLPRRGLYLREDGEMKCNVLMAGFVRKNLDNAHKVLVERMLAKAERVQAHLNASAPPTSGSSTPSSPPAFQPGSHMSSSSIMQHMANTSLQQSTTNRPIASRTSSDSAAAQSARSPLRQDYYQELAGTMPQDDRKPLPRQPTEDEDDPELATIHPALREQYRQSRDQGLERSDTVLPAYHTLNHPKGQFYHEDMAKRPAGKHFAAELEGSTPLESAGPSSAAPRLQHQNTHEISELGDSTYELSGEGQSASYSRVRSQTQPLVEADSSTFIGVASSSSGNGTIDRYSVVSGISEMPTPKAAQFGFGNGADSRFSVVSALTAGELTPKLQQMSFAEQQRQRQVPGQIYAQQPPPQSYRQQPGHQQGNFL